VKVSVDPWKCTSHLQCVAAAPDVFTYDEERSYSVAIQGDVPPEHEAAAQRAVRLCPEGAITVE
jgi:ferredoxin